MKRGEIWWADFGMATGGEIQKRRPIVIGSNSASNRHLKRVQVVPLSSNIARIYPCEAAVTVRKTKNKAMADQLVTVRKQRLTKRIGRVTDGEMSEI